MDKNEAMVSEPMVQGGQDPCTTMKLGGQGKSAASTHVPAQDNINKAKVITDFIRTNGRL
jgi:hypothetical protein